MKWPKVISLMLVLSGCADIQHFPNITQPTDVMLAAGVGDTVLQITKSKSFPNAFGKVRCL